MPDEPLAYLNGRFLPQSQAALPLHDAGFVFGATITDLCRTFHQQPFRLVDHLLRFQNSASGVGIDLPLPTSELAALAEQVILQNAALLRPDQELALVMLATPGPIGYYLGQSGGPGDAAPTVGMHTFPLSFPRLARFFRAGVRLVIAAVRHLAPDNIDPRIKHRSRLHWWLAEQEVHRLDLEASALLLNSDGHVTETAAANFLIVRANTVLSPPRSSILNGVSLQTVEELCGELGIRFREQALTVADCQEADEALLCGTSFCLAGVSHIDGTAMPWPGPVYEKLLAAWSQRVGLDIRGQILANG